MTEEIIEIDRTEIEKVEEIPEKFVKCEKICIAQAMAKINIKRTRKTNKRPRLRTQTTILFKPVVLPLAIRKESILIKTR
jgi:hypothetical protein